MAEDGSLYVDTSNSRNETVVVKLRDSLRQRDPPANAPAALESRLGGNGLSGSTATNSDMYEGHGKKRMDSAINRLERLVNAPGAGEDDHGSASEHELPDDSPADALNDWYDVNDAFIDDSDMREQLTKRTKDSGFVVTGTTVSKERVEAGASGRQSRAERRAQQRQQQQQQSKQQRRKRSKRKRDPPEHQERTSEQEQQRNDHSGTAIEEEEEDDEQDVPVDEADEEPAATATAALDSVQQDQAAQEEEQEEQGSLQEKRRQRQARAAKGTTAAQAQEKRSSGKPRKVQQQSVKKADVRSEQLHNHEVKQAHKVDGEQHQRNDDECVQADVGQQRKEEQDATGKKKQTIAPTDELQAAVSSGISQMRHMAPPNSNAKTQSLPQAMENAITTVAEVVARTTQRGAITYAAEQLAENQSYRKTDAVRRRLKRKCSSKGQESSAQDGNENT